MYPSKKPFALLLIGGVLLLIAFLLLSSVSAALAWTSAIGGGSGSGSGGQACAPPGTNSTQAFSAPSPSTSSTSPMGSANSKASESFSCVPPSGYGAAVVQWAKAMTDALYVNPACGGQISYPNCYYTWYKTPGASYPPGAPTFPEAVLLYGEKVCSGCYDWANGTYQCVSFVRGAYSQVYPMTLTANAFDLWALYRNQPGWMEVPSAAAPPGLRGIPQPGDVMVFQDTGVGHVAIVMSVQLPNASANGSITFSNANSTSPYTIMPLLPDLSVDTSSWPGYTVWGYIRPHSSATA